MKFNELERDIRHIVDGANGNVSLSLSTDEGSFSINPDVIKSAASVIKVPIAMSCLKASDEGSLDLYEKVHLKKFVGGTGVLNYLYDIKTLKLINLIELAIIVSDNTASNLLIEAIGKKAVNDFLQDIGAKHTKLARKFMDHVSLEAGIDNVTTAADMLTCLMCLDDESNILSRTSQTILYEILGNQQFKDKLPSYQNMFGEQVFIGNKTGTLNGVEHDVAIFDNGKNRVYIAVLSTDWKYNHDGQQLIAEVGQKVLQYMS